MRIQIALLVISVVALVAGLTVPISIVLDSSPSILVYALVLFSFPAWLVGAIAAVVAAVRVQEDLARSVRIGRLGWGLSAINVLAIVVCLVWGPVGVS